MRSLHLLSLRNFTIDINSENLRKFPNKQYLSGKLYKVFLPFIFVLSLFLLSHNSFAQITQRGLVTTANTTSSNTLTIAKPSGVVSGDILIVNIAQNETTNNDLSNASLSGWTPIDGRLIYDSGTGAGANQWWGTVLYKVADGTEGANFVFNLDADADMAIGSIAAFYNVDVTGGVKADGTAGGPFDVDPGTLNAPGNNNSTVTATGITTSTNNAAVIMLAQLSDNRTYSNWVATSPATLTELYDNTTANVDDSSVGAAWAIKATAGSTGTCTATLVGNARSGGLLIALKPYIPPTITTGSISPTSYCPGSSVSVPFIITGTFASGNVFTAQLSDANGSFAGPTSIGTLNSLVAGTINATIPSGQVAGAGYRIRVISSNPVVTGSDNGSNITVGVIAPVGFSGSRCGPGTVALRASASTGTINWYTASSGGSSIATGTTFTTPSLSTTTTYYIEATNGSCTSSPRIAVTAAIINPPTITAGGGGQFCAGSTIDLTSSGTYTTQYWTGPNSYYSLLQNPSITNATVGMTGTYTVRGSALSGINLVANGDFESGNTGFGSSYAYKDPACTNCGTYGPLSLEATYSVTSDPSTVHTDFANCADHSTSGANQMIVNGAGTANISIWNQTVNVVQNTDYQFTYWVQSVVEGAPSELQLYANSVAVGPVYTANLATCSWRQFTYNWNSGSSTTAYLSLINQNTETGGNDFALDDIVFQQACVATASVNVAVAVSPSASVTIASSPSGSICAGTSVTFTATPNYGGTAPGYQWKLNGVNVGTNSPTYTSSTLANGNTVSCVLTSNLSCVPNPKTATSNVITMSVATLPSATISYAGSPFCKTITTTQAVSLTGTAGGTFTASPSGLTLNGTTGAITPSTSTAGTYTVTYTMAAAGGCPAQTATATVTITTLPVATFSYTGTPYCKNASDPSPTFSGGGVAGSFSSTSGLVFVSNLTGQIDLAASTPGTYTVTNTITASGGCAQVTATSTVVITALPAATISYSGSPYCSNVGVQSVTHSGTTGGTYSASPAGLTINSGTGAITTGTSSAGTYTVTYTMAAVGGCSVQTATTTVTINQAPALVTVSGGGAFCGSTTLTASGGAGGTIYYQGITSGGTSTAIASTSQTITSSGTYYFRARSAAGCWGAEGSATVTINPISTIVLTSGTQNPIVCSGSAITSTVYTFGGSASNATVSGLPAGLSSAVNTTAKTVTISGTPTASGTYTITTSGHTAPCSAAAISGTVTVNPISTIVLTSGNQNSIVCSGSAITSTVYTFGGGATNASVSGLPSGLSSSVNTTAKTVTISGTPTANGTYTITTSGHTAPCSAATINGTVTINPISTIVLTSGTQNPVVCSGLAIPSTVYTFGGSAVNAAVSGLPSGLSSSVNTTAKTVTISGTPTASGTYTITTSGHASPCSAATITGTVTVNPLPTQVTVSGGGTQCGSTTLTASGGSGGTIYFQGTTSGGTSTATPSSSQTIFTTGTYYFRSQSPGGCWGSEGSATVTINPLPSLVNASGGGTYCGSTILTASGGAGGTIYFQGTTSGGTSVTTPSSSQTVSSSGTYYFRSRSSDGCWGPEGGTTVTINPLPTIVTVSGGGSVCGSTTISASGGTGGTIYYQGTTSGGTSTAIASTSQTITSSGTYYFRAQSSAGCWGPEGSVTVTINPAPVAVTVSGAGTFCGSTTISASGGTGGTIYFQGTTIGGTSTAIASTSQTITSSGTYYFRAQSAAGCWGPEGSATVTIDAAPAAVTVSGAGTFCGSTTISASGGSGGTIYFQGTTSGGTSTASASTSQNISTSGTYYFRSMSSAGCWGPEGSTTVFINTVPSAPVVGTIAQPTCTEATGSIALSGLPASGIWTLTRQPDGTKTTGTGATTVVSGLNPGTYNFTVINEDLSSGCPGSGTGLKAEYFNNRILTGSPALVRTDATVNFDWVNGNPGSPINNDNFSVRWTGKIQACYSENYTFTTRSDDGIRLWVNGTQVINNWTDHGATNNSGTISLTSGQKYDLVLEFYENGGQAISQLSWSSASQPNQIIPQSQLYSEATGCTSAATSNIVIDAQPSIPSAPTAVSPSVATSVCVGGSINLSAISAGNTIYWYTQSSGGTSIGSSASGANFPVIPIGNTTYYAEAHTTSGCTSATRSATALVSVTSNLSAVAVSPSTQQNLCLNETGTVLNVSETNGGNVISRQWGKRSVSGGAITAISGATGSTFTPSGANLGVGTWYVVCTSTPTCGSAITSNEVTVVVSESVGGAVSGGVSPICLGSGTGTLTLSGYSGTIVRWEKRLNGGSWVYIGNTNSTYTENPYSAGTWQYRAVVKNGSCPEANSSEVTVVVDVNTVGGGVYDGNTPICMSSSTGTMNLRGGYVGNVVRWEKRVDGGAWANISNTLTTYSETPSSAGTWEYRALVQSGSCPSLYSTAFSVVVNPVLTIILGSNPEVCQTTTTTSLPFSATTGNPANWILTFNAGAISAGFSSPQNGALGAAPGNIPINIPYSVAAGVYNATLKVITYYPACSSVDYPVSITVNPGFTAGVSIIAGSNPVCNGTNVEFTATPTNGGGSPIFQWKVNGNDVGSNSATLNYVPVHNDVVTCIMTSSSPCSLGSPATSNSITITVDQATSAGTASASSAQVCRNSGTTLTLAGSVGAIQWQTNASGSWQDISGATGATYNTPDLIVATSYRARVTNGVCGTVESNIVEVTIDSEKPVLVNCPTGTLTFTPDAGLCSALINTTTWGQSPAVSATDNCDSAPVINFTRSDGQTGSTFPIGSTTVTLTATDNNGNVSISCTFTVLVREAIPPTITCPSGQTIFCAANLPAPYANFTAFQAAGGSANDNAASGCGLSEGTFSLLSEVTSGSTITRTYQISDYSGNTATCTQVFTVISLPAVTITSPGFDIVCAGGGFTINSAVSASYTGTKHYQWEFKAYNGSSWSAVGGDNPTYSGTLANLGDQYRLLVSQSTDFSNVACTSISNELKFLDVTKPVFTSNAPPSQTGICVANGATSASVTNISLDNNDVADNCTVFANLGISYTINGGATVSGNLAEGTSFNLGTSTVVYTVTDQSGNSQTHTFTITVNENPALSNITPDASGLTPNQGSTHAYSVTAEAGYTYTWSVEKETSPGTYSAVSPSISGQGTASASIIWGASTMPGNYRITVIKDNNLTHCQATATLNVTVVNVFNPKMDNFGDACHDVSGTTTIIWRVKTEPNSVVAPSWMFKWKIFLNGSLLQDHSAFETVTTSATDYMDISYPVAVGDGSEKNYQFEIYDVTDSLGNPETILTDDTDDVKIFTKPSIQF